MFMIIFFEKVLHMSRKKPNFAAQIAYEDDVFSC